MMRIFYMLAFLVTFSASGQEKLIISGKAPDCFISHTVKGRENLQSISNAFGMSIVKLATYNKLKADAKIKNDIIIKIPVTKDQVIQKKLTSNAALYHKVKKGENLFRVSQLYWKASVSKMKQWNSLRSDALKGGEYVIIGYLVNAPENGMEPLVNEKEVKPLSNPATSNEINEPIGTNIPANTQKTETKIIVNTPIISVSEKAADTKKYDEEVSKNLEKMKQDFELEKKMDQNNTVAKSILEKDYTPKEGDEGFFRAFYQYPSNDNNQQFRSGDASIFKTISGWTDRKYYVLMNEVAPKTIVRITGTNKKSICAMVLGPLQEIKGDNGLLLRISNSAAAALGASETKFTVTVTYLQ